MLYRSLEYGKLNFPSPCAAHIPSLLPASDPSITELYSLISTEVKVHSNFFDLLCSIFGFSSWSGLIRPSSINNWQPLQTPMESVSSLAKNVSRAVFAFSL